MSLNVALRDVQQDDLQVFFEHQLDPDGIVMAAFTPRNPSDRDAFMAHGAQILTNPEVLIQAVIVDGAVAGNVVSFIMNGEREVGYWIGREYWGRGVATVALASFLQRETRRPLLAYAAADNAASIRVLEKCGFRRCGQTRAYSNARGTEIDQVVFRLDAPQASCI